MNKRIILAELAKIANELDKKNLFSEANDVTKVMNNVGKTVFNPRSDPFGERSTNPSRDYWDYIKEQMKDKPHVISDMWGVWTVGEDGVWRDSNGRPKSEFMRERGFNYPDQAVEPRLRKPKPPLDLGPFLPDEDIESSPEQNPSVDEEMGSPSTNAVVERSLDEDVIVRYPGPTGKRHIIKWNVKTPAWPGQEITVDWENNRLLKILKTDEYQKRQNVEIMKSPRKMDR
jgi:hypothetical protein